MDASPLSRLPRELRNSIYDLVLYQPNGIAIPQTYHHEAKPGLKCPQHARAIAATCKQIRAESLNSFWTLNTFQVCLTRDASTPSRALGLWFHDIGPEACSLLREIGFDPYERGGYTSDHAKAAVEIQSIGDQYASGAMVVLIIASGELFVRGELKKGLHLPLLSSAANLEPVKQMFNHSLANARYPPSFYKRQALYSMGKTLPPVLDFLGLLKTALANADFITADSKVLKAVAEESLVAGSSRVVIEKVVVWDSETGETMESPPALSD